MLGVTLAQRAERKVSTNEDKRLKKASRIARRCLFLPMSPSDKLRVATCTSGTQAQYGWAVKRPPQTFFDKLHILFGRIAGEHPNASPDLRKLFRGHNADMWFMSGVDQIRAAFRSARDLARMPVKLNSKGPRFRCLTKFLLDLGWSVNGPWIFSHDELGFTLCLHPLRPEFNADQGLLDHMLRESWRCLLYNRWLASDRRDARECQNVPYSSTRCAAARKFAMCLELRNILCGGFIRPMVFFICTRDAAQNAVIRRPKKHKTYIKAAPNCPLCQGPVGTLHHCLWECPARDFFMYPLPPRPRCPLQRRLGWPMQVDDSLDLSILELFRKNTHPPAISSVGKCFPIFL